MPYIATPIALIFLSFSALVFGADAKAPTIPPKGIDTVLVGKSPRDFFKERAKDTDCRKTLKDKLVDLRKERGELKRIIADKGSVREIDAQEVKVKEARKAILVPMAKCGQCAVQKVEERVVSTTAGRQLWYITDGSCQVETSDPKHLEAGFKKMAGSLLDLREYRSHFPNKTVGMADLREFVEVNHETGKFLPAAKIETSPFYTFISVRGPTPGFQTLSTYYVKNEFTPIKDDFYLKFNGVKPPFTITTLKDYTAGGTVVPVFQINLKTVIGSWYVNPDGYLRYFTAADFAGASLFGSAPAHDILLSTIVEVWERGSPQED